MLLCIDVGNTQIALGLYPDTPEELVRPELVRDWRMRTDPRMTADELEVAIRALLGEHARHVTGIAALSTVPSVLRELRLMLDRRSSRMPTVVVGPGVRTGVPLLVDNPREVGADRVVNTLAAHRLFGTACIVVDFGTSTNIDVVSARGEFLGGALAPGIEISLDALATRAAALRTVELVRPRSVIGKNTVECLQSGVLYGFAGQVDGLVHRILDELGPKAGPITVLATGGLAPLMDGESSTITEFVPDLTLLGLRLTYLRNVRTTAVAGGAVPHPAGVPPVPGPVGS
ncbi:type III pantothenate kinase [Pseudonocardia bannensis]|uniref:Type III pantothenate kinase n=1 Tax=Pseudonocardia bannensis TaxID=630973 RepID=A0A848DNC8_9PSEU|nr:type III pantothenate kinase [Pseudonocardia bannensis]NMH94252.1 type III pantothenate kinase [Pseudonocardia bannensis]